MNNRSYLIGILVVAVLLLGVWWFWKSKRVPPAETLAVTAPTGSVNTVVPNGITSKPGASKTNPASASPSASNSINSKEAKIEATLAAKYSSPINVYGKVIDQYGQPVIDAKVKGGTLLIISFDHSGGEEFSTVTDTQGRFSFTGLHGARFGLGIEKTGYKYDPQLFIGWWDNYKPDPSNPAIFHMWKLNGAEPMVHTAFDSRVPYDGHMAAFDLFSGLKTNTGDLQVTLTRNPVQVQRGGDPFDWAVKIQVVGGGLVETSASYPYEAPDSGYQPAVYLGMKKNAPDWTQRLTKTYFIRTAKGDYGRVDIDLTTDSERPQGTGISIEAWMNPSGSRNLEFDPAKAIKPKS